jgi:hypothetical protein
MITLPAGSLDTGPLLFRKDLELLERGKAEASSRACKNF